VKEAPFIHRRLSWPVNLAGHPVAELEVIYDTRAYTRALRRMRGLVLYFNRTSLLKYDLS
jgi:hypothetical protein